MIDVFNDYDGVLEFGMWEIWNLEFMFLNMLVCIYKM